MRSSAAAAVSGTERRDVMVALYVPIGGLAANADCDAGERKKRGITPGSHPVRRAGATGAAGATAAAASAVVLALLAALAALAALATPARAVQGAGEGEAGSAGGAFAAGSDVAYVPSARLLVTAAARPGSAAVWSWLHRGLTGDERFSCAPSSAARGDDAARRAYPVLDFGAPCWRGLVLRGAEVGAAARRDALSPRTLRVAVASDPYADLVSAWRDLLACPNDADVAAASSSLSSSFHASSSADSLLVSELRHASGGAGADPAAARTRCVSLGEFAASLAARVGAPFEAPAPWRPARFHVPHVAYHVVLAGVDIHNASALAPVVERLPFPHLVADPPSPWHVPDSAAGKHIPPHVASALRRFAQLSDSPPRPHPLPELHPAR